MALVIFLIVLPFAISQNHYTFKKEGESCFLPNGVKGICRRRPSCNRPWGFGTLQFDIEAFQPCGFTDDTDEKLFCCYATVERAKAACDRYLSWTIRNPRRAGLISQGELADIGDFPHMVALWYNDSDVGKKTQWRCGGSLISERFAVTAAHCLERAKLNSTHQPSRLRVGDVDLNTMDQNEASIAATYEISKIFVHPLYRQDRYYNDIGLVKTAAPVTFSLLVGPACLQIAPEIPNIVFQISGFGLTENNTVGTLRHANVSAADLKTCNYSYRQFTSKLPRGIISSIICARSDPNKEGYYSDTCHADSGGPLQYAVQDLFYIIGVTSSGPSCTIKGSPQPGLYTRISEFVPWIETIVWRK